MTLGRTARFHALAAALLPWMLLVAPAGLAQSLVEARLDPTCKSSNG